MRVKLYKIKLGEGIIAGREIFNGCGLITAQSTKAATNKKATIVYAFAYKFCTICKGNTR